MTDRLIPMFPLSILPLPGELVPLHIFEPRYRQLLQDAEEGNFTFGIFCTHAVNERKIGSQMKLESVIKRYPGGESDIIVSCQDVFDSITLYRTFESKLYPGGKVTLWNLNTEEMAGEKLSSLFKQYLAERKIARTSGVYNLFQIANDLELTVEERYAFLTANLAGRTQLLFTKMKFQLHLLRVEHESQTTFHLN
jgi:hypothetical protein